MRPDRLSGALQQFVGENLGEEFVEQTPFDVFQLYNEMTAITPAFFVLFPGVDPTPDVERVGKSNGISIVDNTLINISMGQGQEDIAIKALHDCAKKGNWIMV
jgi:dynein heavy chain